MLQEADSLIYVKSLRVWLCWKNSKPNNPEQVKKKIKEVRENTDELKLKTNYV